MKLAETTSGVETVQERRITPRQRVAVLGKIVYNHFDTVVRCTVREISEKGAKLVCKDQTPLPPAFGLLTTNDRQLRDVQTKWRDGELIGVEFVSKPRNSPVRVQ